MAPKTRPSNQKRDKTTEQPKRRTSQQVIADKNATAARKQRERDEQELAQQEVAAFEEAERRRTASRKARSRQTRDDDEEMEKVSHKRTASADGKKGREKRRKKSAESSGEDSEDSNDVEIRDAAEFGDDGSNDEYEEQGSDDEDQSGSESGNARASDKDSSSSGSEDQSTCDEEVSEDEGRSHKKKGNKEKKVKPGVASRAAIRALRGDGRRGISDGKHKAPKKDKSKNGKPNDGLRPNWQQQAPLLPPPGPRVISSKHSIYSSEDNVLNDGDEDDEGPMQQEGGLFDDYITEPFTPLTSKAKATAKVQPLNNPTTIFKKANSKLSPPGLVKNLSKRTHSYYKGYKTFAVNEVGAEDPWYMPSDRNICDWWNGLVGGDKKARISDQEDEGRAYEDFKEIRRLTRGSILSTEWKTKLSETAINAVKAEWDLRKLYTPGERALFAERMLGPEPRNCSSIVRPFIFQSTDRLDWDGSDPNSGESGGGIFMSRSVLKTFAKHIAIVNGHGAGRGAVKLNKAPRGALMMSIQAVNRALEYSLSGELKVPAKKNPTGHFSEENWGDYKKVVEKQGVSKRVRVRRATVFAATITSQLDDERWQAIINAAKNLTPNSMEAADCEGDPTESEGEVVIIQDVRFKQPATVATLETGPSEVVNATLPQPTLASESTGSSK